MVKMKMHIYVAGLMLFSLCLWANPGIAQGPGAIETIAGGNINDGKQASEGDVRFPSGISGDEVGNIFIADTGHHLIRKIGTDGLITTYAGNMNTLNTVNGTLATEARIDNPVDLVVDGSGQAYILDGAKHRVYKVDSKGIFNIIAGTGEQGFSGDGGTALQATFNEPSSIDIDADGNLYIADTGNHRVRKIDTNGVVTTLSGDGNNKFSGDGGPASQASLNLPEGIAVDGSGNIFVADSGNHRIRKIGLDGIISTIAGDGMQSFSGDGGTAVLASLSMPHDVFVDATDVIYIADTGNHRIRMVEVKGNISTIAGNGTIGFAGDGGPALNAELHNPRDLFVDDTGNVYMADDSTHRVRRVDTNGDIFTLTGGMAAQGDGFAATEASLNNPTGGFMDSQGNLYIADAFNHRIRRIGTNNNITTVAGNGIPAFSGDGGVATQSSLYQPGDITLDSSGNLYIADTVNNRIRKVASGGIITTIAGGPGMGFSGDGGAATQAMFARPSGIDRDIAGNLYIADRLNHRIRKIDDKGIISTVVGNGIQAFSGDGGPADGASLNEPYGLYIQEDGTIYVADTGNHLIRKIDANGIITTVAGNGVPDFFGDEGPATEASLNRPRDVFVDIIGNLFIADEGNARVRRVDSNGIMSTVAGRGLSDFSGDGGRALLAGLSPNSILVDDAGNLIVFDANHRIRRVVPQAELSTDVSEILFGHVSTGASRDTTITLTNSGTDTLHIATIQSTAPSFSNGLTSLTIPPGQSRTDTVRFVPLRPDTLRSTLILTSNALSSPDTIHLQGIGQPEIQAIPSDSGQVTFVSNDQVQATIKVLSGAVTGETISFTSHGSDPPAVTQSIPVSDRPLFFITLNSSIPDSINFEMKVTLTYTDQQLADAGISDEASLMIAFFNENTSTWTTVTAVVDPASNTAMFNTSHFSVWALAATGPTGIEEDGHTAVPTAFYLESARPNPFNPTTQISYDVPIRSHMTLIIYNVLGQEIVRLLDRVQTPGRYTVLWKGENANGQKVASGVYIYRITSDTGFVQAKRMTLLK